MMTKPAHLLALVVLLPAQDPAGEGVTLAREMRKHLGPLEDSEVRLRLGEIVHQMTLRAGSLLCGDVEDPELRVPRLHDIANLIAWTKDARSTDFWKWPWVESGGGEVKASEPREPMIGTEELVDLLKEQTGKENWQADNSMELTSSAKLFVNAPPPIQRRVTRVLEDLHREALCGIRLSFTLFALGQPPVLGEDAQGALSTEAWERLSRQAEEGGAVRQLGSVETVVKPDQIISTFSGVRRPAAALAGADLVSFTVPDGLALEASAIPSGALFDLRARLAYTKVLSMEAVATSKGTLRLPRLVEASISGHRSVPLDRPFLLGSQGPLAPEAELPPYLVVVGRLAWVRP